MKTKVFTSIGGLAFALVILSGCASTGNQSLKKETEATVAKTIIIGKTTKAEVKAHFGSPISTSFTDGGLEIWNYSLAKMHAGGANFIPVYNLFAGSANGTAKSLVILFDEKDVVKKFTMSESAVSTKTGLSTL